MIERSGRVAALGVFAGVTAGVALAARAVTGNPQQSAWYRGLQKPPYQPPPWVFGPVWTVLYGLTAYSGWRVWNSGGRRADRRLALALWDLQILLNGAWSWLFFRRHAPRAALLDILFLGGSLAAYVSVARKLDRPAVWAVAPYLAWVGFAAVLNGDIVLRNPRPSRRFRRGSR